jgi:hypothetical protein
MRETLFQDLRIALRQIRSNPALALAVILTLALGIGSTTAVFTLVSAILLRPLPFLEPDRLVRIQTRNTETGTPMNSNEPNLLDWRAAPSVEALAYNYWMRSQLTREGAPAVPAHGVGQPGVLLDIRHRADPRADVFRGTPSTK